MKSGLLGNFAELWDYRDLLRELVGREMKIRYRRSALGFLWSLLTPLYQIVIYTFVFKYIMHVEGKNLSVNILVGLVPWAYFSAGVLTSCAAILRYRSVVKKVYFPRQMVVMATVMSSLVHLALSAVVMFIVFAIVPIHIDVKSWFLVPLVFFETLLIVGLALLACTAHTYFGDVEYILTNIIQVAMFITPVVYPLKTLTPKGQMIERIATWPEFAQILYKLNPMTTFTQGWRDILLPLEGYTAAYPEPYWFVVSAAMSVVIFLAGMIAWRRYEWRFPEII